MYICGSEIWAFFFSLGWFGYSIDFFFFFLLGRSSRQVQVRNGAVLVLSRPVFVLSLRGGITAADLAKNVLIYFSV